MKTKKLIKHGKKKWHHHVSHALIEIGAGHLHLSILLALIGQQAENAEVNSKPAKKLIDKYMVGMISISIFIIGGASLVTWLANGWMSLPFFVPAWDYHGDLGTIILAFFWAWSAGRILLSWVHDLRFNKKGVDQGKKGIRFLFNKMIDTRVAGDGAMLLLDGITLWQVEEEILIKRAMNSGIRPIVAVTSSKSATAFNDYLVGDFTFAVDDEITYYEKKLNPEKVQAQLEGIIDAAWLHVLNEMNLESVEAIEKELKNLEAEMEKILIEKLKKHDSCIIFKEANIHKRQFEDPKLVALAA